MIEEYLDRPIAFHRIFVPLAGITGAVFLSQAIYWAKRLPQKRSGWFYKTMESWQEETGLTRTEQEGARKKLKALGIIEEKLEGIPAKLWFRVDYDALQTRLEESCKQVCGKPANWIAENLQTNTEITTEITSFPPTPQKGEDENNFTEWLKAKEERKANKGKWRNTVKFSPIKFEKKYEKPQPVNSLDDVTLDYVLNFLSAKNWIITKKAPYQTPEELLNTYRNYVSASSFIPKDYLANFETWINREFGWKIVREGEEKIEGEDLVKQYRKMEKDLFTLAEELGHCKTDEEIDENIRKQGKLDKELQDFYPKVKKYL